MPRVRPLLACLLLLFANITVADATTDTAAPPASVVPPSVVPTVAPPIEEAFEYKLSWNGIPAAYLTMTYMDDEALSWSQLQAKVRTSDFVDLFWSLRGSLWGALDTRRWTSTGFSFHRYIRSEPESTVITIGDDGSMTGTHTRPGRDDEVQTLVAPGLTDPAAAILEMRHRLPAEGETMSFDVFTGEARYKIDFTNVGRERLSLAGGEFDAIHLEPKFWRVGKKDDRVRQMSWWVTADKPHTLLRIRSDVFVGAVYCDLVSRTKISGGAPPATSASAD